MAVGYEGVSERLICVTGGTGYLGGALIQRLSGKGLRVRAYDSQNFGDVVANFAGVESIKGDVLDPTGLANAMRDVTDVIHLAGIVTDGLVDIAPAFAERVNVQGSANVAAAAQAAGVNRFINTSSSSVYGFAAEGHADVTEDIEPLPKTAYAHQKLAAEKITRDVFKGTWICLRPATMCGPAPRIRLDPVINVFSKQAWFDGHITVHGGEQYRSNVHIQDAVDVFELMLDRGANDGVYNVTWGNMTVGGIARLVQGEALRAGKRAEIVYQNVPDPRSYRLTAARLARDFGWTPKRHIAEAVQDLFEWFRSGQIRDVNDPMYWNDKRMRALMEAAKR